jgi:hypothetical protein
MNQPTSIQMLGAAIWQELGGEKAHDAEAVYHTLGTLLSRQLLARPKNHELEAHQALQRSELITGTFLVAVPS